jgi:hypothetical protein
VSVVGRNYLERSGSSSSHNGAPAAALRFRSHPRQRSPPQRAGSEGNRISWSVPSVTAQVMTSMIRRCVEYEDHDDEPRRGAPTLAWRWILGFDRRCGSTARRCRHSSWGLPALTEHTRGHGIQIDLEPAVACRRRRTDGRARTTAPSTSATSCFVKRRSSLETGGFAAPTS